MKNRLLSTRYLVVGLIMIGALNCSNVFSSNGDNDAKKPKFEVKYEIKTTPIKCQYRTGTCWNYSTISFLESEVLRESGKNLDLSELFVVRKAYLNKADKFVRYHARANFSQSGQAHDVISIIKEHGIVPESVLPVDKTNDHYKNHIEMADSLYSVVMNTMRATRSGLEQLGAEVLDSIMDDYLGVLPEEFEIEGKKYTAKTYQEEFVKLDLNNYIDLTSFIYKPFYKEVELELPDNWDHGKYYNIPLDDLIETIDNSLKNGYSVVWDGDVIDSLYDITQTIFELPNEIEAQKLSDIEKVSEEERQRLFDNWTTTDDHLLHLVGVATDKIGRKYYMFKDSAGENHPMVYMSESYIRINTIAIMVNKKGLPEEVNNKLF